VDQILAMTAATVICTVFLFGSSTGLILQLGGYNFGSSSSSSSSSSPKYAPPQGFSRPSLEPRNWSDEEGNGGGEKKERLNQPLLKGTLDDVMKVIDFNSLSFEVLYCYFLGKRGGICSKVFYIMLKV